MRPADIDRLGERLRAPGPPAAPDLQALDAYRRTFAPEYEHVAATIRHQLGIEPGGQSANSTAAIREKLRRSPMRLSQMQDIAGCRIVVEEVAEQDRITTALQSMFPCRVHDRRQSPSHGYRAVHLIARSGSRPVEIQARTTLQHL